MVASARLVAVPAVIRRLGGSGGGVRDWRGQRYAARVRG
jgi:hypothetical protein